MREYVNEYTNDHLNSMSILMDQAVCYFDSYLRYKDHLPSTLRMTKVKIREVGNLVQSSVLCAVLCCARYSK